MVTILQLDKLIEFINTQLKPKEKERKQNGEIFTPLTLVNEMLDKLPENVWTNKDLKWLDPAVGIGNFPIIVYQRLMKGLEISFPDEEERRRHILEEMLYVMELNPNNITKYKTIFCSESYRLNIYEGNTLKVNTQMIWGGIGFDVVVGNPPFNPPKTETGSSGNSIWQNFVMKSFSLLNNMGYLCFVHPPGWKKPADKIFQPSKYINGDYSKQVMQGHIWQFLKEHGAFSFIYINEQTNKKNPEFIEYFPAIDFYVYQKGGDKQTLCNTTNVFLGKVIYSKDVKIDYNLNYLPNLITNETLDILNKITSKEGDKCVFRRGIDPRGYDFNGKIIDWLYEANKRGFQYQRFGMYASTKKRQLKEDTVNMDKVVFNYMGGFNSYIIQYIPKECEIGVLKHTMYFEVDTKMIGDNIVKFFNSNIVKFIFLITQYSWGKRTSNEPCVAKSITIPPEDVDDYYTFFNIEQHREYIETTMEIYN